MHGQTNVTISPRWIFWICLVVSEHTTTLASAWHRLHRYSVIYRLSMRICQHWWRIDRFYAFSLCARTFDGVICIKWVSICWVILHPSWSWTIPFRMNSHDASWLPCQMASRAPTVASSSAAWKFCTNSVSKQSTKIICINAWRDRFTGKFASFCHWTISCCCCTHSSVCLHWRRWARSHATALCKFAVYWIHWCRWSVWKRRATGRMDVFWCGWWRRCRSTPVINPASHRAIAIIHSIVIKHISRMDSSSLARRGIRRCSRRKQFSILRRRWPYHHRKPAVSQPLNISVAIFVLRHQYFAFCRNFDGANNNGFIIITAANANRYECVAADHDIGGSTNNCASTTANDHESSEIGTDSQSDRITR